MRAEAADLTARLVAIDSVNPELVVGGAGEREIAAFVAGWAREAGLEVTELAGTPERPSVLARAPGAGGGRTLLLCGHLDTVGVEGMSHAPHDPRIDGDRLYGRGAYDMKAGLAAALLACRDAAGRGLAGDVVVAAVADEEHASIGVREALAVVEADAAVVTEPTELGVVVAHKGFAWSEVEVTGRAAHGSRPHLGIDAIAKAGPVLTAIGDLDRALGAGEHPLLGRGSVHASLIRGGAEMSSYPESCVVGLERRTLPGETATGVERELGELLDRCRAADPELVVEQRPGLVREPFEVDPGADVARAVLDAAGTRSAGTGGASFWADSAFIAAAGIPTVLFGPGGQGAHAAEEWVSLDDAAFVATALVDVAEALCS
ncbi:MAG TPA: M20/M25/M40 family metallo-hydrolase [Thermoleophilaceae bacterium]|nr:M20/M25/M40 family metallo-hydrolase [Thermoleophilaceae bacterium]